MERRFGKPMKTILAVTSTFNNVSTMFVLMITMKIVDCFGFNTVELG